MSNDAKRIAVVAISISNPTETSKTVNNILTQFGEMIVGRMGVPYKEKGISIISLIVDGTNNEIGALSGKLGNLEGVKSKVSYML